ncbi:MAG: HAD family phosphatase [Candidatus Micrarchaeia archaeon]
MFKAVLFDFDGVVVRSEELHMRTFLQLLEPYGVDVPKERWYREFAGTGSRHIFEVLIRENGIPLDPSELVARRKKIYEDAVRGGALSEMPGVRAFLSSLKEKGIPAAIVSGSHRTNVELALAVLGLGGFFSLIISGDDVPERKPDPGPYLAAARKLGLVPGDCLVIEDSRSGMMAAKAAGMRLVCVFSHPSVDTATCDITIEDFDGLDRKLERL